MKRTFTRALSLFLCILLICTCFIPALAQKPQYSVPVIYMAGQQITLIHRADGQVAQCGDIPDGYITEAVNDCLPYLSDAILKNEWDAYYEKLVSWVAPLYEEVQLNHDGVPDNGTYLDWDWQHGNLPSNVKDWYGLSEYSFCYDWRLDPCSNADLLNEYIADIKKATGSDKVNIIGRCEGACVLDAYIAEYGHGDVNRLLYYTPADNGVDGIGEALSGEVTINSEGVERWAATELNLGDEFLNEFLSATIIAAENTGMLKLLGMGVTEFYELRLKQALPEIILATYGTMPAVYAMASNETADKLVDFVFAGKKEEYAGLIEKIENYNSNVRNRQAEYLLAAEKDGVQVSIIAKYGYQSKPFGEVSEEISDGACSLSGMTKGATTAKTGKKFDSKYVINAQRNGFADCISPDLQVDASTCLFPDTTWIIKYVEHRTFPYCADLLMDRILRNEEPMTVNTYPEYPRFMVYDESAGALYPMTEENSSHEVWENFTEVGYFTSIVRFFRLVFKFLKDYFRGLL